MRNVVIEVKGGKQYAEPKTPATKRTIDLSSETVKVLEGQKARLERLLRVAEVLDLRFEGRVYFASPRAG